MSELVFYCRTTDSLWLKYGIIISSVLKIREKTERPTEDERTQQQLPYNAVILLLNWTVFQQLSDTSVLSGLYMPAPALHYDRLVRVTKN